MPKICVAEECVDGRLIGIHYISTPKFGEKGFYRQGVSINAFATRELKVFSREAIQERGNYCADYFSFEWNFDHWKEFYKDSELFSRRYKGVPEYHHDSVWDFYTAVNYDYKKQKYLSDSYRSKK